MQSEYVYAFNEGTKDMRLLLGDKGANLAEMTRMGLPVPFGFTVTTESCNAYYENGSNLGELIKSEMRAKVADIESVMGHSFGNENDPLLVSVRVSSPVYVPGMMETIINLGLNDKTVEGISKLTGNERFAYDIYRNFIQNFGIYVLEIDKDKFEEIYEEYAVISRTAKDRVMLPEYQKLVIREYFELIKFETGNNFPQDVYEQLYMAVAAAFKCWKSVRAVHYRRTHDIADELGAAVNVQAMVFGNIGNNSCTGVVTTRNPINGSKKIFGEFFVNAQRRRLARVINKALPIHKLEKRFPRNYSNIMHICEVLENHYKDAQSVDFTIEEGKLYMLQTQTAKRSAEAAVHMACDMVEENLIDRKTAVMRIGPESVEYLMHPSFDEGEENRAKLLAVGTPVAPGVASGRICFNKKDSQDFKEDGDEVILVCDELPPKDVIDSMYIQGIIAADEIVASGDEAISDRVGRCCILSVPVISVDIEAKVLKVGNTEYRSGDYISINCISGNMYEGKLELLPPDMKGYLGKILSWADEFRSLRVRANADSPETAERAIGFGAEGIGLCRTEYMFFKEERIQTFREMVVAENEENRRRALDKLLLFQKSDFEKMYRLLRDKPLNIRLLDPPLHEFLPETLEEDVELSEASGVPVEKIRKRADELKEVNPMLGHRGLRIAVTYPEIAEMQMEAILGAAICVSEEIGVNITPEILIPLAQSGKEFADVKATLDSTAMRVMKTYGKKIEYHVGTMMEVPRACLTADELAKEAEFFSFGTNDLTQLTLGFSFDDTKELVDTYIEKGIFSSNPFKTLDIGGVGRLIKTAAELGRKTRPELRLGLCGDHGGDAKSISFCQSIGMQYVSCSPYRVPVARLAAAQAAIGDR